VSRPAPLSLGELIEHWTLRTDEIDLVAVKHGDSKLAFALLLRFYGRYGRFPRNRGELHPDAVEFMARAVKADLADLADLAGYDWSGWTSGRGRMQVREHVKRGNIDELDQAHLGQPTVPRPGHGLRHGPGPGG
jgi:hypothetical protein